MSTPPSRSSISSSTASPWRYGLVTFFAVYCVGVGVFLPWWHAAVDDGRHLAALGLLMLLTDAMLVLGFAAWGVTLLRHVDNRPAGTAVLSVLLVAAVLVLVTMVAVVAPALSGLDS